MQTLHIEDARCSDDHTLLGHKYAVANWDQVAKLQLEHAASHWGPDAVKIKLFMADGTTIDPGRVIRGFPIPVVAKDLETFIHVRNQLDGYANFSDFEAYLRKKHADGK